MAMLWFRTILLSDGWAEDVRITITDGRIAHIETGVAAQPTDECHAIGLPGLPNLHSHAFQRGMAGLAEVRSTSADNFWTWREMMYRFLDRMDPDDMQAIAAQAYVEMLESGFTRVGEFHYVHHDRDGTPYANIGELADRIVTAAQETGIALTLLPAFYAHGSFGAAAPSPGQRRFLNDVDRFSRLMEACARSIAPLPGAILGLAPHSLRAATAEEIDALLALARGPIHIHVAEQTREVDECLAWCGRRPVDRLLDTAAVDARWCLIHATHMTNEETRRLARSGAVAGLCPITEANLGDGVFPARAYLDAGGRFGIGSDSNVLIDAAEELRTLEYSQRLWHRARNILAEHELRSCGRTLFAATLVGGAQALGAEAGLAEGRTADIVSLNVGSPSLVQRDKDAVIDGWIFASRNSAVDCVWRHGKKLVEGGCHYARARIAARFGDALRHLLS
jgi:formimidoylglutamate deiminase